MSTAKLEEPLKMFKKPSNYRINTGDGKYFSDIHAASEYNNGTIFSHKNIYNERQPWKTQRISFDMHNLRNNSQTFVIEKQTTKEKKHKQPKSPGGKLASFLNSLFNQTSSKKKKSSKSLKDDEECPDERRRRRSSISHVFATRSNFNNNSDTKPSIYPSSITGFRTPPPYSYTTKKSNQELHGYISHQKVLSLNRVDEKKQGISERKDYDWLSKGYQETYKSLSSKYPEKSKNTWSDHKIPVDKKEFKKFNEDYDDGADSDSSSDLFELKNYDIDCYSCTGLPVYETTTMDGIKKVHLSTRA
ncbi:hypothetical protein LIER_18834 [Lithospermum erythrorhizon]|uniref:Protein BIG GRAIN 1-like E n=1 Tax=Lithospermum erythrorhizon TaxID=34254 RepID=A0AAV3QKW2_LITER